MPRGRRCSGPPTDWPDRFVTSYASSHPWEDFAETWAHFFHMVDTLETAAAFGMSVRPNLLRGSSKLSAKIDFDPHLASMERLVDAWLPLTYAMNSINRSMGQPDLYPFVLSPTVIGKISFVHARINAQVGPRYVRTGALQAIVAGLRRGRQAPR